MMRLPVLIITLFLSAMTVSSVTSRAADPETSTAIRFDTPGALNPIIPGYFADPTVKKFGDTYYFYSTTDGN